MVARRKFRPHIGTRLQLLAAFLLILFLLDPAETNWGFSLTVEFIPIILALLGGAAYIATGFRASGSFTWQDWLITALIAFITMGGLLSAYGTSGFNDSYARIALSALAFFPYRMLASQPKELEWFVRHLSRLLLFAALIITSMLLYWHLIGHFIIRRAGVTHIFHAQVFILSTTTIFYYYSSRDRRFSQISMTIFFLVGILLTYKLTGFIVFLLTALSLYRIRVAWMSTSGRAPGIIKYLFLLYGILTSTILLALYPQYAHLLPSGSVDARSFTYFTRAEQFFDSPIFGTFFTGPLKLGIIGTNLYAASHSDILDLLAFGGLVGFCLFAVPTVFAALMLFRLGRYHEERLPLLLSLGMLLSTVLVMTFNPILLIPRMGGLHWVAWAILLGIQSRYWVRQKVGDVLAPPVPA